jgi:AcrR family transcriptional regulator
VVSVVVKKLPIVSYNDSVANVWSPNQLAKREEIVDAAARVLLTQGVAACTARAIAEASPLTTSALHYYFADVDEIVDLAFAKVMHGFLDRVETAADGCDDPVVALWTAAWTYLDRGKAVGRKYGARAQARAPLIWFEYQVITARRGGSSVAAELMKRAEDIFEKLVVATGIPDAEDRASLVFASLLGAAVRDTLSHREQSQILNELSLAIGLPLAELPTIDARSGV